MITDGCVLLELLINLLTKSKITYHEDIETYLDRMLPKHNYTVKLKILRYR